jgi:N-acetyl-gamma-glutamylphosphate reductase
MIEPILTPILTPILAPILLTVTLVLNQGVTAEECREVLYNTYPPNLIQQLANHKTTFNCQLDVMGRLQEISDENERKLKRKAQRESWFKTVYEKCGDSWCEVDKLNPQLDRE